MLLVLLILIPLLAGVISFFLSGKMVHWFALASTILVSAICFMLYGQSGFGTESAVSLSHISPWLPSLGSSFSLSIDGGVQLLMILLTAILFPIIILSLWNKQPERTSLFYGLVLLAQSGLMGVFLAKDALLFYIFWELALIPVYFLSSMYGGERKIPVTFKFFIYTFVGSLLLLVAFLIIYQQTPIRSFSWDSFVITGRNLSVEAQSKLFWLMFAAFAIKMPIFPFHTWQPDAYEQSATPVTIILSAIMVKMGLYAVIKWLLPVLPEGSAYWSTLVMALSILGIIYASILALTQQNIKRLIAYSSIAHVGLMCATLFSHQLLGVQGVAIQMFNHGINIAGLWLLVNILEHRYETQDLNKMGGIAKFAPAFTISLVVISMANIALPLTNGFIGEFMMFNGLFNANNPYRIWFTVLAGLGVILSAVYTLGMIQKVAYGEANNKKPFFDLSWNEWVCMGIIIGIIFWLGFYPKVLMNLVNQ